MDGEIALAKLGEEILAGGESLDYLIELVHEYGMRLEERQELKLYDEAGLLRPNRLWPPGFTRRRAEH
jgi:hypothetical protein